MCGALARVSRDRARTQARTCVHAQATHVSLRSRNAHLTHISATVFIRSAFPRDWMSRPSVSLLQPACPKAIDSRCDPAYPG